MKNKGLKAWLIKLIVWSLSHNIKGQDRNQNMNKLDETNPPIIHSFVVCALYSQNTNIF